MHWQPQSGAVHPTGISFFAGWKVHTNEKGGQEIVEGEKNIFIEVHLHVQNCVNVLEVMQPGPHTHNNRSRW